MTQFWFKKNKIALPAYKAISQVQDLEAYNYSFTEAGLVIKTNLISTRLSLYLQFKVVSSLTHSLTNMYTNQQDAQNYCD
jgi:hypothetical protein